MAKRKVDPRYLEWAEAIPEEGGQRARAVDAFLNSKAADTVLNLHTAYTQESQKRAAAEHERDRYKPNAEWVEQNRHILGSEYFPTVVQEVLTRTGKNGSSPSDSRMGLSTQQMNAQLSQDLAAAEQRYMDLSARVNTGELQWETTQPILQDLVKYAGTLRQQQQQVFTTMQQELEQVRQTQARQEREFPQLVANSAQDRFQQQKNAEQLQKEGVQYLLEATEYLAKHKDRDVSRAIQEFQTGRYATFKDAAEAVFGEDDYEALIQSRVDERLAKLQAEAPPVSESNGEGAMSSFPVPIRPLGREERTAATAPDQGMGVKTFRKAFDKSRVEEAVNNQVRDIITRGVNGLSLT